MDTLENAKRRVEYWKSEHTAANIEIERLRTAVLAIEQRAADNLDDRETVHAVYKIEQDVLVSGTKEVRVLRMSEAKFTPGPWISVKDRLPPPIDRNEDEGETYAVVKVNRYGVQFKDAAQWQPDTGYDRWWLPDPRPDYTITHWMPLPELPAELAK